MSELSLNKSGLGTLKSIAHGLGVPGSRSHTKYTKKNKDELIQQILKFQKMKKDDDQQKDLTLSQGVRDAPSKLAEGKLAVNPPLEKSVIETCELETPSVKRSVREVFGEEENESSVRSNESESDTETEGSDDDEEYVSQLIPKKNNMNSLWLALGFGGVIILGLKAYSDYQNYHRSQKSDEKQHVKVVKRDSWNFDNGL